MQAIEIVLDISQEAESRFRPAQMRALRRRAKRIHAGARSSTEILNALASRVERDPAAMLRHAAEIN